jgi:hypothetical protein
MTRFDVQGEGLRYRIFVRRSRLLVASLVGFLAALTVFLGVRFSLNASWGGAQITSVVILGIIIATGAIFVWLLGPSASFVELDQRQIRFGYSDGRIRSETWDDPRFRLVIDVTTGANDAASGGKPASAVFGRRGFQDFLTPEAYQAILETARQLGLTSTQRPSPRPGWTRLTITRTNG